MAKNNIIPTITRLAIAVTVAIFIFVIYTVGLIDLMVRVHGKEASQNILDMSSFNSLFSPMYVAIFLSTLLYKAILARNMSQLFWSNLGKCAKTNVFLACLSIIAQLLCFIWILPNLIIPLLHFAIALYNYRALQAIETT